MPRIKIELPDHFPFSCKIPVRITDVNYGGHVGNDTILTIVHEARMQFLYQLGYTELEFAGNGMIMSDAALEFRSELFYGDEVYVSVAAGNVAKVSFDLFYKLEKSNGIDRILVANARTGMICFDYAQKKIVTIPQAAREKLQSFAGKHK